MQTENYKYYEQLFEQYISLCNKIIEENKSKFPYSKILNTKKNITVKIIDDRPKLEFAVGLEQENLKINSNNFSNENKVLLLKINHLEDFIKNQDEYITHPEKINWNLLSEFI